MTVKCYIISMFLQKDKLSEFDFISVKEFILALFLMLVATVVSFLFLPEIFQKVFPVYSSFFKSHYFMIFVFIVSAVLNFYIIYYFSCKKRNKSLKEGLFLYPKPKKTIFLSVALGIIMPLSVMPIAFKFMPREFYAIDLLKTKEGMIFLFVSALIAPIFEEIFYRGFVFTFFQSKLNSFWAVIITALFFGFSHFINIGNAHILLSLFIYYGFVLSLLRYFTNSLIPPIITHFVHNLILIVSALFFSKN